MKKYHIMIKYDTAMLWHKISAIVMKNITY